MVSHVIIVKRQANKWLSTRFSDAQWLESRVRLFGDHTGIFAKIIQEFGKTGRFDYHNAPGIVITALVSLISGASLGPETPLADATGDIGTSLSDRLKLNGNETRTMGFGRFSSILGASITSPFGGALLTLEMAAGGESTGPVYFWGLFPSLPASAVGRPGADLLPAWRPGLGAPTGRRAGPRTAALRLQRFRPGDVRRRRAGRPALVPRRALGRRLRTAVPAHPVVRSGRRPLPDPRPPRRPVPAALDAAGLRPRRQQPGQLYRPEREVRLHSAAVGGGCRSQFTSGSQGRRVLYIANTTP